MKNLNRDRLKKQVSTNITNDKYERLLHLNKLIRLDVEELLKRYGEFCHEDLKLKFIVKKSGSLEMEIYCEFRELNL